jgi:hypothetical protein
MAVNFDAIAAPFSCNGFSPLFQHIPNALASRSTLHTKIADSAKVPFQCDLWNEVQRNESEQTSLFTRNQHPGIRVLGLPFNLGCNDALGLRVFQFGQQGSDASRIAYLSLSNVNHLYRQFPVSSKTERRCLSLRLVVMEHDAVSGSQTNKKVTSCYQAVSPAL